MERQMAKVQLENDGLHELAGHWREQYGELADEHEKEVTRLQEMHRKNVKDVRTFKNNLPDMPAEEVGRTLHALLNTVEQRSMAALGAKV